MNRLKKLNKIYILSIILSMVMIVLILPACQQLMIDNANFEQHKCCMMKEVGSITANHILYFQQFLTASLTNYGNLFLTFMILFVLVVVGKLNLNSVYSSKQFYKRQKIFHMKPWDPLRLALAQGLIHNKHLS